MPSTSAFSGAAARATNQRTLAISTASVIGLPAAWLFHTTVGIFEGSFLLLMIVAVGVPTAFDRHWSARGRSWQIVPRVAVACVLAGGAFTGLYLVGTEVIGFSALSVVTASFLLVYLGPLAVLSHWT